MLKRIQLVFPCLSMPGYICKSAPYVLLYVPTKSVSVSVCLIDIVYLSDWPSICLSVLPSMNVSACASLFPYVRVCVCRCLYARIWFCVVLQCMCPSLSLSVFLCKSKCLGFWMRLPLCPSLSLSLRVRLLVSLSIRSQLGQIQRKDRKQLNRQMNENRNWERASENPSSDENKSLRLFWEIYRRPETHTKRETETIRQRDGQRDRQTDKDID